MTKDEIKTMRRAFGEHLEPESWHDAKVLRLLEERERLLEALKYAFNEDTGFNHDVAGIAYAAIDFAEAPAGKEGTPVCGFVVSEDWRAKWTCGRPAGHEGPHSGATPPAP